MCYVLFNFIVLHIIVFVYRIMKLWYISKKLTLMQDNTIHSIIKILIYAVLNYLPEWRSKSFT